MFNPHFAGNVHASVRASGIENEGSCPTACATSPVLVCRGRSFRNWSMHQDRSPRWVGPHGPALASMGQRAPVEVWKSGGADLEFRLPCSSSDVEDCNRLFGIQRHDHVLNTSQWNRYRSGAGFQNFPKSAKKEVSGERSAVSQDMTNAVAWRPTATLPRPLRSKLETRATCRGIVDEATASAAAHKRMTGKYVLGVCGGSGFLAKAANHFVLRGYVLDTKFGPRYDVTKPLVLTRIRQDVSAGKCFAGVIFPKLFPPLLPSQTCFIVLARRGFSNTRAIRGCGPC